VKKIKTTITIDENLWRDLKVYAAKRGLKLFQVVEDALRKYLEEAEKESKGERHA